MIQPRRYKVGYDMKRMTWLLVSGCVISAIVTAILMYFIFSSIYKPALNNMKMEHETEVSQLNAFWEEELRQQEQTLMAEFAIQQSAMDAEITRLKSELETSNWTLSQIQTTTEDDFNLLREYWYVFKYTENSSGLSAELIKYVDAKCKEWDVNPHWMWAIYWVESNFKTGVDNTTGSGARGLGQVMPSTGRSFWENIFGNGKGSFYTDMLYDPYVNVDITVAIIGRHLSNDWTMYQATNQYSGGGGSGYYNNVVNTASEKFGITLNDNNWRYPKE